VTRFLGILGYEPSVGKTTTAINLAALLAAAEKKTLVLDCAPDLEASHWLGFAGNPQVPLDGTQALAVSGEEHLGLLPVGGEEGGAAQGRLDPEALRASCSGWDFVIADLPDAEDLQQGVVQVLDGVIILVLSSRLTLPQLAGCVNSVTDLKARFNPDLEIEGVLVTLADRELQEYERAVRTAGRLFPVDIYPFAIPRDEAFARGDRSPSLGFRGALTSRATRGYVELAMEVLSHER
jgi:chromosome partitioning protein